MYSAWSASRISGIAAAVATAAAFAVDVSRSSVPEHPPVWLIAATLLVVISMVGGAMTLAVRGGLRVAGCHRLALRFVLSIPAVSLLLMGVMATIPIETHAVMLDKNSGRSVSNELPLALWIGIFAMIVTPGLVAYAIGRLSRNSQVPPDKSPAERT